MRQQRACTPQSLPPNPPRAPHSPPGPARYTFKAYEPHFSRPCIVAAPEHGRLVLRTAGRTPGQPGDALCEAAYGKVQLQLAGAPSPVALASDGGLSAAMAPRADQPLCSLLLAIYRGLLSARALAPPRGPAARLPAVAE